MKWIKHMTATRRDEKIARLIGEGGKDGIFRYGLYWAVQEIIAEQMDGEEPVCSVTYPVTVWSCLLSLRGSLVFSTLSTLAVTHLVTMEKQGSDITVGNRNLLKYRDEWSSRKKTLPSDSGTEQNKKQKHNKKKKEQKPSPAAQESAPDPRHTEFKGLLEAYWRSKNTTPMPWDASEAGALGTLLKSSPTLTATQFHRLLGARFYSEVNHGDRPRAWIAEITRYEAGPIDRFGQPTKGKPNGKSNRPLPKSEQTMQTLADALGVTPDVGAGPDGCPAGSDTGEDVPADDGQRTIEGKR